ncbi:ATP-dependent RNA helicase [Paecilomyces variotii No. 5]|uniref:RNA helicase n=1 Tax=Byssochlamys spectabilis (strain No. 5 / NBRC 109023) TaxID=1356009 RepID=V5FBZ2_BYSSN|nr:ATP-dependent RNA helicase [Paecilomyces variotii No. 5]
MAPITSKKRSREDDDFVLTLSDDENPVDVGEEEDGDEDELNSKSAAKTSGTKRKREVNDAATGKTQKQKKQKRKQGAKGANGVSQEGDDEEEEEDENNALAGAEDDGALNPDFEFDVAGATNRGIDEDFDGWVMDGDKKKGGDKKGVDIDAIIERRRERKKEAEERKKRKEQKKKENGEWDPEASDGEAESEDAGEDEEADGDAESVNFEDDELLAEDAFGMGAGDAKESEDEDEDEEDEDKGSGSDSEDDDEEDEDEDAASDNDSVASPVAHPDDVASDSDDDENVDEEEAEKRKAFFAPEEKSDDKSEDNGKGSFQDYNLSRPILRGLASVGFSTPTPIQRKTIPVALLGKDIVGGAVTGSGKTGAFIIPILERLLYRPRKVPTSRVAILMPTRELAVQCYNVATKLATFTDITFCQLVGGFSLREQENVLKKRPDVIIATPGRFIDHMRNSASFTVDTLEILVLDEADRMLEDGFAHELNEILTTIPKSRQTMLFSATMTNSVDKLIRVGLNRPVRLMVDSKKSTVTTLVQEFVRLRPGREGKRLGYLMYLCKEIYTGRVIIFFRQKREAHRVRIVFGLLGLKAAELHGSMTQEQRIKSVEDFREGRVAFLLATDVASRGLDIKGVETVINYEAPQSHEIYLHRVGRTARAGRSGRACTIAAEPDRKVVKQAVKASKAQGAKVVSRVVEPAVADSWAKKVEDLAEEVDEILKEEKQEKLMSQAEMQVSKGENMLKHEREIMSRPKRTWFETERDKQVAKKAALLELNGEVGSKKKKVKLSNKDKKKLDASRERHEGRMWKKGRKERETPQKPQKKGGAKKGKSKK